MSWKNLLMDYFNTYWYNWKDNSGNHVYISHWIAAAAMIKLVKIHWNILCTMYLYISLKMNFEKYIRLSGSTKILLTDKSIFRVNEFQSYHALPFINIILFNYQSLCKRNVWWGRQIRVKKYKNCFSTNVGLQ